MKSFFLATIVLSSSQVLASGYIPDYDYQVTDIAHKGLTKEQLFSTMDQKMMSMKNSICANRAHVWAYDFSRKYNVKSGKIFIFFGKSIWTKEDKKGWMYHVAPYIVENGQEWIMEAGYPSEVKKPLQLKEWVENETYGRISGDDCLEISDDDTDLTPYFYNRQTLPEVRNGKPGARCYIKKVPGYYWFPMNIAQHELGRDENGKPMSYDPKNYSIDDVLNACIEASSTSVGRIFGGGKGKCKKYLNVD
jgi:hypothetical protein